MAQGFTQFNEQLAEARIAHIQDRLERAEVAAETLNEAYSDAVRQMLNADDIGWQKIGGGQITGVARLSDVKLIGEKLADWTISNPLLKRGLEMNCSYLLSDPYDIQTLDAKKAITPQQMNLWLKKENQVSVFSLAALSQILGEWFATGNSFVEFDRATKEFQQVPLIQIADVIYDPMDSNALRYVKRSANVEVILEDGTRVPKLVERWVPVSTYDPEGGFPTVIDRVAVDINKRMVVSRVNRQVGSVFGVPEAFAAAPWALAYSAYLRDGTKVLAALAEWVWKVTPAKKTAAEKAAASIRRNPGGNAGGTLFTDMDVQSLPKADAVDLNTGRPLAAQAAAALGVSVVLLLTDPGQSGAYGTAQTLSDPNRRTMQSRREMLTEFIRECLRLLGIKSPDVVWTKMAPGTDKEEVDLLAQMWGTGLFEAGEIRPAMAKVGKLTLLSDSAPTGVLIPNNEASLPRKDIDGEGSTVDADGTNEMTNGVGRDNLGQGPISKDGPSSTQRVTKL